MTTSRYDSDNYIRIRQTISRSLNMASDFALLLHTDDDHGRCRSSVINGSFPNS